MVVRTTDGRRLSTPPPAPSGLTVTPLETKNGLNVTGIGDIRITPDEINNALVILAGPSEYGLIESALRELDIVPLQVFIEAAVAEVTLTNDLKYGLQYFFQQRRSQAFLTETTAAIVPNLPGFAYTYSILPSSIKVVLSLLESITHIEVLSSPQLMVLNNQTATLTVGDQVPIATSQAVSVIAPGAPIVNSIQFKETGIILKITPRVNQGGMIMMDIAQEVSDVGATTSSTLNSPTIRERKITTTIAAENGATVALGGLIKDSRTNTKDGIPILQDIPVLGALFRSTEVKVERTELLILITPRVVESTQRAVAVTEELRRKLAATKPLFEMGK